MPGVTLPEIQEQIASSEPLIARPKPVELPPTRPVAPAPVESLETLTGMKEAFAEQGVSVVAESAGRQHKRWGKKHATREQAVAQATAINDEWDRLREVYQTMPPKITHTLFVTDHDRGRASLNGKDPIMAIKGKEWDEATWERLLNWEKQTGLRRGSERPGTQIADNFRHELAHNLSTPDSRAAWGRIRSTNGWDSEWFRRNVSDYAATNENEEIAETFAIVTAVGYIKGSLPVELEEFVDNLAGGKWAFRLSPLSDVPTVAILANS